MGYIAIVSPLYHLLVPCLSYKFIPPYPWKSCMISPRNREHVWLNTVDGCEILHHQKGGWNRNKMMGCLPPINWWFAFRWPIHRIATITNFPIILPSLSHHSPIILPSFSHHSPIILPSSSRGASRGARNAAWWRWRPTRSWAASWSSGVKRCPNWSLVGGSHGTYVDWTNRSPWLNQQSPGIQGLKTNGNFCYNKDGENVMGHFVEDCQQYGFSQHYIGISAEETGSHRYSPKKRVNLTNKKRGFQQENNRI